MLATVRQRHWADRRAQWWSRAEWAFEQAVNDDVRRQAAGAAVLAALARSDLAARGEQLFAVAVTPGDFAPWRESGVAGRSCESPARDDEAADGETREVT